MHSITQLISSPPITRVGGERYAAMFGKLSSQVFVDAHYRNRLS